MVTCPTFQQNGKRGLRGSKVLGGEPGFITLKTWQGGFKEGTKHAERFADDGRWGLEGMVERIQKLEVGKGFRQREGQTEPLTIRAWTLTDGLGLPVVTEDGENQAEQS